MSTLPSTLKPLVRVVILAVIMDRKDDLPAPDWPMTVRNYPLYTLPFNPDKIFFPDLLCVRPKFAQDRLLAVAISDIFNFNYFYS